MAVLRFKTEVQAALFEHELCGQISDGNWENSSPRDHWKSWCDCEVEVGEPVGRDFHALYDRYNFVNKDLLEVVEKRMLGIARVTKAFGRGAVSVLSNLWDCDGWEGIPTYNDDYWDKQRSNILLWLEIDGRTLEEVKQAVTDETLYNQKNLLADLREMKQIIRTRQV